MIQDEDTLHEQIKISRTAVSIITILPILRLKEHLNV